MAQQTLNNGMAGLAFRTALNANFTDLYTNKADKSHASSTTDYGVGSTSNFGHVKVTSGSGLGINNGVISLSAATTAEAGAGSSNAKVMTPAKVKDAVIAYSVISDGNIILKVGGTQPATQSGKTIIWIDTTS